jgi:hypothetical protein
MKDEMAPEHRNHFLYQYRNAFTQRTYWQKQQEMSHARIKAESEAIERAALRIAEIDSLVEFYEQHFGFAKDDVEPK